MQEDIYTWCAIYRDNSVFFEYDLAQRVGVGRGFAEVNLPQVVSVNLLTPDDAISHSVAIPCGAIPVFFRRRKLELDSSGQKLNTIHCIGWKHGDDGVYLFVFEDGSSLLTSDLQAV